MIRFLKDATDNDKLINSIIAEEWEMLTQVQQAQGAQLGDERNFYIKRYGWLSGFAEDTLQSYLSDLRVSKNANINMVALKYAYMMQKTDFAYFDDNLRKNVPVVSDAKKEMVESTVAKLLEYKRSVPSADDVLTAEGIKMPSYEAYILGELETYTESTLKLIKRDVEADSGILAKMKAAEASV
jgi:hypothetical protein